MRLSLHFTIMANKLDSEKKIAAVSMLAEGTSIRSTPAMAANVTGHVWTVEELLDNADALV